MGLEVGGQQKKERRGRIKEGARGRTHTEEEPCKFTRVAIGRRERQGRLGIEQTYALLGNIARLHQR
jgi:hypothetical protein